MQAIGEAQRYTPGRPDLVLLVGTALAYFLAGKLGLSFAGVHSSASAVWPPTGTWATAPTGPGDIRRQRHTGRGTLPSG